MNERTIIKGSHDMIQTSAHHVRCNQSFISAHCCSGLPIQLNVDGCAARLTCTTGISADCQPKPKTQLQARTACEAIKKITSYTNVALLAKKEWYLRCCTDEPPGLFRSPPGLAKNNLVLGLVLLVDHPACTNKSTQKYSRAS
jgi:hypothetical protein